MHFPPFWFKARKHGVRLWRWSNVSLQDAIEKANNAAEALAERVHDQGWTRSGLNRYGYGERPFREQVLRTLRDEQKGVVGVVSRNSYGCLVLNVPRVLFVDIDIPGAEKLNGPSSWLNRLSGTQLSAPFEAEGPWLHRAENWANEHPGWGWRVYRTRGGLRLLATHRVWEPDDPEVAEVFEAMDADPLYRQLCLRQKCFRARLTPKPWRCGVHRPHTRWPFTSDKHRASFVKWENRYRKACDKFATTQWIARFGADVLHPEVALILPVHDDQTRATVSLPLA
jgi:hypothetical protein